MMQMGELQTEKEISRAYPVLYFNLQSRIANFLIKQREFNIQAKEIVVRINWGET